MSSTWMKDSLQGCYYTKYIFCKNVDQFLCFRMKYKFASDATNNKIYISMLCP